jgi:PIN domain nuclease of toxin-antitoxin system
MRLLLDTHVFLWFVLLAQSITENMPIVSADRAFDAYGVSRLW